jgi:hypothetical protein
MVDVGNTWFSSRVDGFGLKRIKVSGFSLCRFDFDSQDLWKGGDAIGALLKLVI